MYSCIYELDGNEVPQLNTSIKVWIPSSGPYKVMAGEMYFTKNRVHFNFTPKLEGIYTSNELCFTFAWSNKKDSMVAKVSYDPF